MGTIHERMAKAAETEERRELERAARRRELAEKQKAERAERRKKAIAAGLVYEPGGGWDAEAADALAALVSSSWLWDAATRGELTGEQVMRAIWCLGMVAENGGEPVRFAVNRAPRRGFPFTSFSERDLLRLHELGIIVVEKTGGLFTISRGPRVEELRKSFAEQFEGRARGESVVTETA